MRSFGVNKEVISRGARCIIVDTKGRMGGVHEALKWLAECAVTR